MIPIHKGKWYFPGKEFLKDPIKFTIEKQETLGDFYEVKTPFIKLFVTTNPEAIQHVLVKNHRNYLKSPAYRELELALGKGLLTNEGDSWFRQRRLAQPAFYKKSLEGIFEKMIDTVMDFSSSLITKKGQQVDFSQLMMEVTSDIVLKALFSVENPEDKEKMHRQVTDTQNYLIHRTTHPYLIPWLHLNGQHRTFLKDKKMFDDLAYRFINEHRNAENPPADFITMLLDAEDAETGERMSDLQIRDEAITIFAAGHETSANALAWTFYLLSQHPEIFQKLKKEAQDVLGDRKPQFTDIQQLSYAKQVIEEGMRLYPPAYAVGRESIEEDEILGEKIPKKAVVFVSIAAAQRDPKSWENPDEFNPDRFLPERAKKIPKYAYMPFGAGPRMCIGNHFAIMEMQLILAVLARDFEFEFAGKKTPPEYQPLVTMRPKEGMPLIIK